MAGEEVDPTPQVTLKKTNEDRDDERSLILSMCYWNFLFMTHGNFVLYFL